MIGFKRNLWIEGEDFETAEASSRNLPTRHFYGTLRTEIGVFAFFRRFVKANSRTDGRTHTVRSTYVNKKRNRAEQSSRSRLIFLRLLRTGVSSLSLLVLLVCCIIYSFGGNKSVHSILKKQCLSPFDLSGRLFPVLPSRLLAPHRECQQQPLDCTPCRRSVEEVH